MSRYFRKNHAVPDYRGSEEARTAEFPPAWLIDGGKEIIGRARDWTVVKVALDEIRSDLSEERENKTHLACLTDKERDLFFTFKYPKRRAEWLAGRIAAKTAGLKLLSAADPDQCPDWGSWSIEADAYGRPFIKPLIHELGISISHSAGLAVAMAARRAQCGIDIQKILPKLSRISERFAFASEISILDRLNTESREDPNYKLALLWSAKEAVKKTAAGQNLPGFLNLMLIKADTWSGVDGPAFKFTIRNRQKKHESLAIAGFYGDYSLALSAVP